MTRVFVLHHIREQPDGTEERKLIGVYSSEANAQSAIDRLRLMPGFKDYPDDFSFGPYELDKDYWADGFFTYSYSEEEN